MRYRCTALTAGHEYLYVFTYIRIMAKVKLTLSIDKRVIMEAKEKALLDEESISELVERFLESVGRSWADSLRERLGVKQKYVSYEDVMKKRPAGSSSGKIIRELRDERANSVFR